MSGLKAELNRIRRELDNLPPAPAEGGKFVLPGAVWQCIAGTAKWTDLTPDEAAVWTEYREHARRKHAEAPGRELDELEALTSTPPEGG